MKVGGGKCFKQPVL